MKLLIIISFLGLSKFSFAQFICGNSDLIPWDSILSTESGSFTTLDSNAKILHYSYKNQSVKLLTNGLDTVGLPYSFEKKNHFLLFWDSLLIYNSKIFMDQELLLSTEIKSLKTECIGFKLELQDSISQNSFYISVDSNTLIRSNLKELSLSFYNLQLAGDFPSGLKLEAIKQESIIISYIKQNKRLNMEIQLYQIIN